MRIRAAVRPVMERVAGGHGDGAAQEAPLVLVGLSGGADSLALAAATVLEARDARIRSGAVVVDHGLQEGSAEVASHAAEQARWIGLDPVVVRRARIDTAEAGAAGGLEAAARRARYAELAEAAAALGAAWILTAHTRDDQAEQTLLAIARGSGGRSLAGIPGDRRLDGGATVLRPLLAERFGITRSDTEAACADLGLRPWRDPHNEDVAFARVRVRSEILPALERALGPGAASGLARTADLVREDADALDALAESLADALIEHDGASGAAAVLRVPVEPLREQPDALRNRVIRIAAARGFGSRLSRDQTLAIAALVTAWRGQGRVNVPGVEVAREGGVLVFRVFRPNH